MENEITPQGTDTPVSVDILSPSTVEIIEPLSVEPIPPVPINSYSLSDNYIPNPPKELETLLGYLDDPNLENEDIDRLMCWPIGETGRKLLRYEQLKEYKKKARALGLRRAGLSKQESYTAYKEGLSAERETVTGEVKPDHKVRILAADRVLTLLGEKPVGGGVHVAVGVQVNSISDEERALIEAYKRESGG